MNRRVMLVITDLAYGGAETQVVQLAVRMQRRGWSVKLVSMLAPRAHQVYLAENGIDMVSLDMKRGMADPRGLIRLARLVREWKPEVVHSHMVHANFLARFSRLLAKVPVLLCTAHNINEGPRWREIGYRLSEPLCDLTTNVSKSAVERYLAVGAVSPGRIIAVPNGVDTERFAPAIEQRQHQRRELGLTVEFVWLTVGRLEAAKDYATLLHAFKHHLRDQPRSRLLVVGKGSLERSLQEQAMHLGIEGQVHFLGIRSDVPSLMSAADAFVMSSAWEGLPMVLLEAASSGLPIVATDVGGNHEVVVDGVSGHLVPRGMPKILAEAMSKIAGLEPGDRSWMGLKARQHVATSFSLEAVAERWEEVYLQLWRKKHHISA